ncbi:MAG TPA: 50S ribosomal protein L33 [Candidatus Paceibacterota bacterium]|nr:50S ribosomal protein L33 [Candidatus Paceibacterota bacterium]
MAKSKHTDSLLGLKCSVCGRRNYYTKKNKKKVERKLAYEKYCAWCRKKTAHKEVKMSGK